MLNWNVITDKGIYSKLRHSLIPQLEESYTPN